MEALGPPYYFAKVGDFNSAYDSDGVYLLFSYFY